MYTNIGAKIKGLAIVVCIVGIIVGVIAGLTLISFDDDFAIIAILLIAVVALISWVSSFVLYGFGELVENSGKIVDRKAPQQNFRPAMPSPQSCDLAELQKLRMQGIITEEEYQKKLSERG